MASTSKLRIGEFLVIIKYYQDVFIFYKTEKEFGMQV